MGRSIHLRGLDRWITGNWGEDQWKDDEPPDSHCSACDSGAINVTKLEDGYRMTCEKCGHDWEDEFLPDGLVTNG